MEQHRSECSLEPVACEMKEFGCSVVVPRKKLARHMRESELQHLTAMTMLNLRLTRQLQQESTERDKKIERLMFDMQERQDEQLTELKADVKKIEHTTSHILEHEGRFCSVCDAFTFTQYSYRKCSDQSVYSDPLYSHHHGYMFRLKITYGYYYQYVSQFDEWRI